MATKGFIVRNAVDAGSTLDLAEPDALDFNLLSRNRYGVVEGCDNISVSGSVVTVTQGVVAINDMLVALTSTQCTLPTSSQAARFDLIAVNTSGVVIYVRGEPSPNPIYPEYGDDVTVLAAVMVRPGSANNLAQSDVTDKRVFLPRRFLTTATDGDILASYAATPSLVQKFRLAGDGHQQWTSDTHLFRSAPGTLSVQDNLDVGLAFSTDTAMVRKTLTVAGDLSAANLLHGAGAPLITGATGTTGDLYQDQTNGGLWSFESGAWARLSTTPIPPGMIMASLSTEEPAGWLFLNGRDVSRAASGGLWDAFPAWRKNTTTLTLPQANGMFLRQGAIGTDGGKATMPITVNNLPAHKHLDSPTTEAGGDHTHTATTEGAGGHAHATLPGQGTHDHDVDDPTHAHIWADGGDGGAFVAASWDGNRRLDGPFNDASHPTKVKLVDATTTSITHLTVKPGQGAHVHYTDTVTPHTHPVTVTPYNAKHTHNVTERSVGGNQELAIIPPFMAVNYLIKT